MAEGTSLVAWQDRDMKTEQRTETETATEVYQYHLLDKEGYRGTYPVGASLIIS